MMLNSKKMKNKKFVLEIFLTEIVENDITEYPLLKKTYEVCLGVEDLKTTINKHYIDIKEFIKEKIEKIKDEQL